MKSSYFVMKRGNMSIKKSGDDFGFKHMNKNTKLNTKPTKTIPFLPVPLLPIEKQEE